MRKIITVATALALTACASTPTKYPEMSRAEKIANQQKVDKARYDVLYQDTLTINGLPVQIIGRNAKITDEKTYHENNLVIIKRSKTAKVATAKTLVVLASVLAMAPTGGESFSKDELKGDVLEPKHPNNTLAYARPVLANWANTSLSKFAPADNPIEKIVVAPKRFYLVYENLVGKESYHLTSKLDLFIYNSELNSEAYQHVCQKDSDAKTLSEWQANDYAKVDEVLQEQVKSCVADLTTHQKAIYDKLAKNPK